LGVVMRKFTQYGSYRVIASGLKFVMAVLLVVFIPAGLYSQEWKFVKEKDGIRVYTGESDNSSVKSFKGVAELKTTLDKVYAIVGNIRSTDNWDKSIRGLRVLSDIKDKSFSYYLIYSLPWPLHDRDLCVEVTIIRDTVDGSVIVSAKSNPSLVPLDPDLVRIRNYWQRWIIEPLGKNKIRLTLEGFADPAGSIPGWLSNMVVTDTPLNMISDIRKKVE
jgi:hypothetical protein